MMDGQITKKGKKYLLLILHISYILSDQIFFLLLKYVEVCFQLILFSSFKRYIL